MDIRSRSRGAVVAACLFACVVPTFAQTGSAEITGLVRDASALPLPGATIAVSRDGRPLATTQSGSDGSFTMTGLPDGTLQVSASLPGFRPATVSVAASSARRAPVSLVLAVGGFSDAVTVTASREARPLTTVPSSVAVVSGRVLEQGPGLNLVETLQFVPGVAAGNVSGVDDLRISIRGAGIRAGFGSRGVLLMADGYPVTEPDGQTPHFDGQIDLANAERVEVVKGPSSAMYGGAALGGVVNVVSRVPARRPAAMLRAEAGSYAFGKAYAAAGLPVGPLIVSGTLGYTRLNGFREHNSLRDVAGTLRADWSSPSSRITISMLGTDASLELPGTLNRAQFEADPSQVRPIHVVNDWRRENRVLRFGGRFERQLGSGQSLELDSYGQVRDLRHPIFVVIDQHAQRYVGHARYRVSYGRHALAGGLDVDRQWVDDRWFVNAGGRSAFRIRADDDTVGNVGAYAQDEIALGIASVTLGVRADRLRYDLVDLLPADGDATDLRTFRRVSPKAGVTVAVRPGLTAYGNVSTGFEAPTLGEVRLPAGFNAQVRPQTAVSVEGGARGEAGPFSYDVAAYRMRVNDEILPETIAEVTVYRNVARATHTGVELSTRAAIAPSLVFDATYAYSRFVLDEFGAFSGHRLPGIPPHAGTVRASLTPRRWDAFVALRAAASTYVDDANHERANAYGVWSAGAGHRLGRVRLFVRAENLGNVRYTDRVQVNDASGFFYYPAPGRQAQAGLEVRW